MNKIKYSQPRLDLLVPEKHKLLNLNNCLIMTKDNNDNFNLSIFVTLNDIYDINKGTVILISDPSKDLVKEKYITTNTLSNYEWYILHDFLTLEPIPNTPNISDILTIISYKFDESKSIHQTSINKQSLTVFNTLYKSNFLSEIKKLKVIDNRLLEPSFMIENTDIFKITNRRYIYLKTKFKGLYYIIFENSLKNSKTTYFALLPNDFIKYEKIIPIHYNSYHIFNQINEFNDLTVFDELINSYQNDI